VFIKYVQEFLNKLIKSQTNQTNERMDLKVLWNEADDRTMPKRNCPLIFGPQVIPPAPTGFESRPP
jgi:hypothetical protein